MTTFGRAFWTADITFGQKHGLDPPILRQTLVFLHIAVTGSGITTLNMEGGMERKSMEPITVRKNGRIYKHELHVRRKKSTKAIHVDSVTTNRGGGCK